MLQVLCERLNARWPSLNVARHTVTNILGALERSTAGLNELLQNSRLDYIQEAGASYCCAVPVPNICQSCGGSDMCIRQSGRPAHFLQSEQPVRVGSSFSRVCKHCHCEHHLHGYNQRGSPVRTPYPQELDHGEWEEYSKETYVHAGLFRRFDLALLRTHCSPSAFCDVETQLMQDACSTGEHGVLNLGHPQHRTTDKLLPALCKHLELTGRHVLSW